jgi:hypothetical protein
MILIFFTKLDFGQILNLHHCETILLYYFFRKKEWKTCFSRCQVTLIRIIKILQISCVVLLNKMPCRMAWHNHLITYEAPKQNIDSPLLSFVCPRTKHFLIHSLQLPRQRQIVRFCQREDYCRWTILFQITITRMWNAENNKKLRSRVREREREHSKLSSQ